ncbi:MAG: di-heme-cytochrome C peroxidase [Pyrinomonadaceae bacterium]
MKIILISLFVILLLIAACKPKNNNAGTPTPGATESGSAVAANGLSVTERATFYHLAEGSELYPYSWMKALHTAEDKPFLDNPERFGLLPDPNDPDGLPIGLTKAARPGVPLGEMVGVNCAGCHVGEISFNNRSYRIDGAPNLFDLVSFDIALFKDSEATVKDPKQLFAFLVRWWKQGHNVAPAESSRAEISAKATDAENQAPPPPTEATRELLGSHKSLDDLRNAGEVEKSVADEIEAIVARHSAAPMEIASAAPRGAPETAYRASAKKAAKKAPAPNGIFAKESASERETSISGILGDVEQYVALLYSYIDLLKNLANTAGTGSVPSGGFGRVDAFGGARNLLFPKDARPATAPVSYPYLWGFGQIAYFHYAANTNSILERNIGQALGLGASFDKTFGTFATSVNLENTNALEELAYKIQPPPWPIDILGPLDSAKVARGKTLYQQNCAACHEQFALAPPPDGMPAGSWVLNTYALNEIGTDPNEALNFAAPVTYRGKKIPLPEAIALLVPRIESAYYKKFNTSPADQDRWNHGRLPAHWHSPAVYSARPLAGIWATAPYLHNGSVLTLYDLLLPGAKRPTTFYVGAREFDPVHVGYVNQQNGQRSFQFDTTKPGNSNLGHEYGTNLSEDQKLDLLEFLKSLTEMPLAKN